MGKLIAFAFVLLATVGCCSAQNAAAVDAQWDGACRDVKMYSACFVNPGDDARICYAGAPAISRDGAALRVKLAKQRLDRLGMNCDGWQE